jgi:hypothetical protein
MERQNENLSESTHIRGEYFFCVNVISLCPLLVKAKEKGHCCHRLKIIIFNCWHNMCRILWWPTEKNLKYVPLSYFLVYICTVQIYDLLCCKGMECVLFNILFIEECTHKFCNSVIFYCVRLFVYKSVSVLLLEVQHRCRNCWTMLEQKLCK